MLLSQISVENTKNDPQTLFERPKSGKCPNSREQSEQRPLWHSKWEHSAIVLEIDLKLDTYSSTSFLHILLFSKFINLLDKNKENNNYISICRFGRRYDVIYGRLIRT